MLAFALALAAFALFGIATPAHHARLTGGHLLPVQRRRLRIAAWIAVAGTFVAAIAAKGWVFGPILWLGALMAGAAAIFLLLNALPARSA